MPTLAKARAQRFQAYVERLSSAVGHLDRHGPLRDYVTGLCLPGERKSVKPMAARVDFRHVRARHQSMHHFVANAAWDESVDGMKRLASRLTWSHNAPQEHSAVNAAEGRGQPWTILME